MILPLMSPSLMTATGGTGVKEQLLDAVKFMQNATADTATTAAVSAMSFSATDASILTSVFAIVSPPALLLMATFFIASIGEESASGKELKIDNFIIAGMWLVLADLLLSHASDIISVLLGLSNNFGKQMQEAMDKAVSLNAATPEGTIDGLENQSLFSLVFTFMLSLLGFVLQCVTVIVILIVVYSAKIELMVRFAFSPIGFANAASSSGKHEAVRYLRKLIASAFYCAAIVLVLYIANTATSSLLTTVEPKADATSFMARVMVRIETPLFALVAPFSAIGAIAGAKAAVNEAFGA